MSTLGNKQIMASNIRRHMKVAGVTPTEVCNFLHIPMPTFSDWINAKTYPRIDKIELLANYFGVTKADLVEEEPTPVSESGPSDPITAQIMGIICQMSPEERRLYLENLKTLRLLQEQGRKPDIQE